MTEETNRRPLAQVPVADLPTQLRIDADEMNGWGAGNEAEHARQAADEIERLSLVTSTDHSLISHRALSSAWRRMAEAEKELKRAQDDGSLDAWHDEYQARKLSEVGR